MRLVAAHRDEGQPYKPGIEPHLGDGTAKLIVAKMSLRALALTPDRRLTTADWR
jgi:hypothetical protein